MRPAFAAVTVAAVLAGACGEEEDGGPPPAALPEGAPVEIDAAPRLQVGVVEGEPAEEFDGVRTPFLTSGGDLAVPDAGSAGIRLFGPDGAFLESLGGPGRGPGEFVRLRNAWPRGDTIEAWDSRARRITRFLPGGDVEVVDVRADEPLDAAVGPLEDGWALVAIAVGDPRDSMSVHRVSRDGSQRGPIVRTNGMARYRTPGRTGPHPLTPTAIFDVHRGEVYVGESLTPVIGVHDPSGAPVRELRLDLEPPGSPSAVFAEVGDSAVAGAGEDGRAATRQRLAGFPEPERLSVFWDVIVDEEGFVWVRPYDPMRHSIALGGRPGGFGGPGGAWLVLSPDGEEVATIEVPDGLEPRWIGSDAIVGVHQDELGVESVRVHELRRR